MRSIVDGTKLSAADENGEPTSRPVSKRAADDTRRTTPVEVEVDRAAGPPLIVAEVVIEAAPDAVRPNDWEAAALVAAVDGASLDLWRARHDDASDEPVRVSALTHALPRHALPRRWAIVLGRRLAHDVELVTQRCQLAQRRGLLHGSAHKLEHKLLGVAPPQEHVQELRLAPPLRRHAATP